MTKLPKTINFEDVSLSIIDHDGKPWLTSANIARALDYADTRKVTHLYNRNKGEFSADMSQTLKMGTSGNLTRKSRIFSPRGAHLIAMFARTPKARHFRKWVLDVLDGVELAPQPATTLVKAHTRRLPSPCRRLTLPAVTPTSADAGVEFDRAYEAVFIAMGRLAGAKIRLMDELARHRADAENMQNIRKMLEVAK